jgi:hypothetical protein
LSFSGVSVGILPLPTDYDIFSDRIAEVRAANSTAVIPYSELDLLLKMDELQALSSQPVAELAMKSRDCLERFRKQEQVATLLIDCSENSHGFTYNSETSQQFNLV